MHRASCCLHGYSFLSLSHSDKSAWGGKMEGWERGSYATPLGFLQAWGWAHKPQSEFKKGCAGEEIIWASKQDKNGKLRCCEYWDSGSNTKQPACHLSTILQTGLAQLPNRRHSWWPVRIWEYLGIRTCKISGLGRGRLRETGKVAFLRGFYLNPSSKLP